MDRPRLAIIIPAHREAASIARVVREAARHGEVIVIDDCSPDDTAEQARGAGATVLSAKAQLGYEGALRKGFAHAATEGFTHVVTIDADGEHDPELLATFRQKLIERGIPLVLGIRPRTQRMAETVMGLYLRARFGVRDILCGMKGYDLALYRANGGFSRSDSIGTELAVNALRRGTAFEQLAVHGQIRADSPRFDRTLRANLRILAAFGRIVAGDLRPTPTGAKP